MGLSENLKSTLKKIHFVERYTCLSDNHSKKEVTFENYQNEEVIKIIRGIGYDVKFMRSENFFRIREKNLEFQFQFNIRLKFGACEFIFGLTKNNERIPIGGPWGLIARSVSENNTRYPLPCFESYEELEEILKEAFKIYEDFKEELIKSVD